MKMPWEVQRSEDRLLPDCEQGCAEPQRKAGQVFHGDVFDVTMRYSKWLAKLGAVERHAYPHQRIC